MDTQRRGVDVADSFSAEQAKRPEWFEWPEKVAKWSYDPADIKRFEGGKLNIWRHTFTASSRQEG